MSRRPNVVFVLTDDQGYGDLHCTGNPIINTPNIDCLYNESAHFTNFHTGPTCAPSRSGLMTGHYANSTGVWHTVGGRSLLRKDEWTIATALKENGYATGIFGKWHLGDSTPYQPYLRGFDKCIVHGGGGISQTPDFWGNDYFDDTYFVNGTPKKFKGYCTDVFFGEAKKFITENKDKPFFCYIALNAPHGPHNVANKYSDKYISEVGEDRAKFYGMIEVIDENVGKLREYLKEINISDNTIFVFMTDNGSAGGVGTDKDGFVQNGYNWGMRGKKNSEYDGGHRVPFFLYWKDGGISTSENFDDVTSHVDFMPTILDMCGVPTKENVKFHGMSLYPLLQKKSVDMAERVVVTDSQRVLRPIKWRKSAVCSKKWRLINGKELYDIQNDLEQRKDVASQHPDVVADLRKHYEEWWKLVSVKFENPIPIEIGSKETFLTCHDAINEDTLVPYSQKLIREGMVFTGFYDIDVTEIGDYTIELRRWPAEANVPISADIKESEDVTFDKEDILRKNWDSYMGSTKLNITDAELQVQGQTFNTSVSKSDTFVSFDVSLQKGMTTLKALFSNKAEGLEVSAYFIHVIKK